MRIRYLEKDNKDLELDLEDVDATLQINKSIISTLVDSRTDITETMKQTIAQMQDEINLLNSRNKRMTEERENLKA